MRKQPYNFGEPCKETHSRGGQEDRSRARDISYRLYTTPGLFFTHCIRNKIPLSMDTDSAVGSSRPLAERSATQAYQDSFAVLDQDERSARYVILQDGSLRLGKTGVRKYGFPNHNDLAYQAEFGAAGSVIAAGRMEFNHRGQVCCIDNHSGHYRPEPQRMRFLIRLLCLKSNQAGWEVASPCKIVSTTGSDPAQGTARAQVEWPFEREEVLSIQQMNARCAQWLTQEVNEALINANKKAEDFKIIIPGEGRSIDPRRVYQSRGSDSEQEGTNEVAIPTPRRKKFNKRLFSEMFDEVDNDNEVSDDNDHDNDHKRHRPR